MFDYEYALSHHLELPTINREQGSIDELDRCKPNYSVEVLEQIKHFFSVPGIVFVLSIDKEQLGHAIRGAYNSEFLNTNEYLRRFIDLEYSLPSPSHEEFTKYLYEYFDFTSFFNTPERRGHEVFIEDGMTFKSFSSLLFKRINASLRQQEKLFSNARVVLLGFNSNNYVFPTLFIFLLYLKEFHSQLYIELTNRQVHPHELALKIYNILPQRTGEEDVKSSEYTEAILLHLYNNYYRDLDYNCKLFEREKETNKEILLVKSAFKSPNSDANLLYWLIHFQRENYSNLSLKYLTDRIDLLAVSN